MKKIKKVETFVTKDKKETLELMDIYPIDDLRGCKVYEAIDHAPAKVYYAHMQGRIRLGQLAIKRIIENLARLHSTRKAI